MHRLWLAAITLLLAWPTGSTAAGFRIEAETLDLRGEVARTHSGVISFAGGRVRLEDGPGREEPVWRTVIYRADRDLVWSLDDEERAYLEIDRATITEMDARLHAARRELERRLRNLPPQQRDALQRLLGSPRREATPQEPVVARAGDGVDEVAGRSCRSLELFRKERRVGEACVIEWNEAGMARTDLEVFRRLGNFLRETMGVAGFTPFEIVPLQSLELLDQLDGFPVRMRWQNEGQTTSEVRVTAIEPLASEDGLFDPPDDYRRRAGLPAKAAAAR